MNTACVSIVSRDPLYEAKYKVLVDSIKKYLPQASIIRYYPEDFTSQYTDILQHILASRPEAVLRTFFNGGFDNVIFLGADVEFFQKPYNLLNRYAVVTHPHILEPLPDDGFFPSNQSIMKAGNINSDIISWPNIPSVIKFLEWQKNIMKTKCISTNEIFYDQTWLNFAPFFLSEFCDINHDPGYNVAYWNYKQRNFRKEENRWLCDYAISGWTSLNCFQYSGIDLNDLENISIHQNRYKADGDFLEFLKEYKKKVNKYLFDSKIDELIK